MTLDELQRALASEDTEVRRTAVIGIGDMSGGQVGQLLVTALGDADWRVRKEAVGVAQQHAERLGVMDYLVDAICQGENVGLRNAALNVLELLGPRASDVLLEALPKVAPASRRFVVEALACGGDDRVVGALRQAASSGDANLAGAALDVLGTIGGERATEVLRMHLGHADPYLRMAALQGLNRLGAVLGWTELEPLLSDKILRRAVVPALGRSGAHEAVDPLFDALSLRGSREVGAAAEALVELSSRSPSLCETIARHAARLPDSVRQRLRELIGAEDSAARRACVTLACWAQDEAALGGVVRAGHLDMLPRQAVEALAAWGEPAVQALLRLPEVDPDVPRAVALELTCDLASALASDGGLSASLAEAVRTLLRARLNEADPELVATALRCLVEWAEPDDAQALVRVAATTTSDALANATEAALLALARRVPRTVERALEGVALDTLAQGALCRVTAAVAGERALTRLQTALSAQSGTTRRAAIEGLAQLAGAPAAELISFSLADESLEVQLTAAAALGGMRDAEGRAVGTEALLLALRSDNAALQAAAARALGQAGDARAVQPLRGLMQSTTPGVAVAAMASLRALGADGLPDVLAPALQHPDSEVVKQALLALNETGDRRLPEWLQISLEHPSWDVRRLSAQLLAGHRGPSVAAALRARQALERDSLVLDAIAEALERVGSTG